MHVINVLTTVLVVGWGVAGQELPKPAADGRYTISAQGIRAQARICLIGHKMIRQHNICSCTDTEKHNISSSHTAPHWPTCSSTTRAAKRSMLFWAMMMPLTTVWLPGNYPLDSSFNELALTLASSLQPRMQAIPRTTRSLGGMPTGLGKLSSPSTARHSAHKRMMVRTPSIAVQTTGHIVFGISLLSRQIPSPFRLSTRKVSRRGCLVKSRQMWPTVLLPMGLGVPRW